MVVKAKMWTSRKRNYRSWFSQNGIRALWAVGLCILLCNTIWGKWKQNASTTVTGSLGGEDRATQEGWFIKRCQRTGIYKHNCVGAHRSSDQVHGICCILEFTVQILAQKPKSYDILRFLPKKKNIQSFTSKPVLQTHFQLREENCALLGYYAASNVNFLSTFRNKLSGHLKMGPDMLPRNISKKIPRWAIAQNSSVLSNTRRKPEITHFQFVIH